MEDSISLQFQSFFQLDDNMFVTLSEKSHLLPCRMSEVISIVHMQIGRVVTVKLKSLLYLINNNKVTSSKFRCRIASH